MMVKVHDADHSLVRGQCNGSLGSLSESRAVSGVSWVTKVQSEVWQCRSRSHDSDTLQWQVTSHRELIHQIVPDIKISWSESVIMILPAEREKLISSFKLSPNIFFCHQQCWMFFQLLWTSVNLSRCFLKISCDDFLRYLSLISSSDFQSLEYVEKMHLMILWEILKSLLRKKCLDYLPLLLL